MKIDAQYNYTVNEGFDEKKIIEMTLKHNFRFCVIES